MKLTLEHDLISRLVAHPEEAHELLSLGIEATAFTDAALREVVEFALTFRAKHSKVPSASTIETRFGVTLSDPPEPLGYYAHELIRRNIAQRLLTASEMIRESLTVRDVDAATATLEETAHDVRMELSRDIEVASAEDVAPRLELYELTKTKAVPPGIPMPWAEFTDTTLGWKPGDFGLIVARTGVGKSWYTVFNAHSAWADGRKVLVVSMEMRPQDLHIRHDAYVAQVPFEALQRGTLTPDQEARYRDAMDEMRSYSGFNVLGYNMAASVSQIQAAIERLQPDIVFVDGAYLCRPTGYHPKMSRNDKLEAVAAELTSLASAAEVPIIGSIQFNREQKKKAVDADLGNIYGSDTWAQNADFVFALMQTREDALDNAMRVSLIKGRNCPPFAARIAWDLTAMEFDLLEFEKGTTSVKPVKPATPAVSWGART